MTIKMFVHPISFPESSRVTVRSGTTCFWNQSPPAEAEESSAVSWGRRCEGSLINTSHPQSSTSLRSGMFTGLAGAPEAWYFTAWEVFVSKVPGKVAPSGWYPRCLCVSSAWKNSQRAQPPAPWVC